MRWRNIVTASKLSARSTSTLARFVTDALVSIDCADVSQSGSCRETQADRAGRACKAAAAVPNAASVSWATERLDAAAAVARSSRMVLSTSQLAEAHDTGPALDACLPCRPSVTAPERQCVQWSSQLPVQEHPALGGAQCWLPIHRRAVHEASAMHALQILHFHCCQAMHLAWRQLGPSCAPWPQLRLDSMPLLIRPCFPPSWDKAHIPCIHLTGKGKAGRLRMLGGVCLDLPALPHPRSQGLADAARETLGRKTGGHSAVSSNHV